jgi:regulator of sigma E protease
MSWFLAAAGFAVLIVLHELGHFMAAKAVGMRVERFALFFPPYVFRKTRGETEYCVGTIPLGGFVRISGMNPQEEIPEDVAHRAYYRQPPWKRIVVIAAGPLMNVLVAFAILWVLFLANGEIVGFHKITKVEGGEPAAGILHNGDRLIAIDGKHGDPDALSRQIRTHRCAGPLIAGCRATTAARVTFRSGGAVLTKPIKPRYDAVDKRMRLGFGFGAETRSDGPLRAASLSATGMWRVTKGTVSALARIVHKKDRKQISGVVGTYEATRESFAFDTTQAFNVLAIISLSLAIVNLFPFLPLDGGHIFWALAEKVRGRAIPFGVMERAMVVGFLLVLMLFAIGLSNDIGRLRGDGFGIR